ncbi:DBH-like monooxygenase protein 1 [Bulinus truncatus]|nr:DBH-like monooxygenase protein 1 [Bulinus truncatus]
MSVWSISDDNLPNLDVITVWCRSFGNGNDADRFLHPTPKQGHLTGTSYSNCPDITDRLILFGIAADVNIELVDVVLGGVAKSKPYFTDMHGTKDNTLLADSSHDWNLVNASESEDKTTLVFLRQLDSADPEDLPINNESTWVLFDYELFDPENEQSVSSHKFRTKHISFLSSNISQMSHKEDVHIFEFHMDNFSVPEQDMYVQCQIITLPELRHKHHLIRFEPIIQSGNENIVHHILLYTCDSPINKRFTQKSFNCGDESPIEIMNCRSSFVFWTRNGPAFDYPPNAGYPLGGSKGSNILIMEIHYKSDGLKDYLDNSGLRIFLTKHLRDNDAGQLGISNEGTGNFIIPPFEEKFVSLGYCHEECISKALGNQEIRPFIGFVHAHSLGRKIRVLHFRNGTQLSPLVDESNYDSNQQILYKFEDDVVIRKGDTIIVQCEYNSSRKTTVTFGGAEMCTFHLFYYPQVYIHNCASSLKYKNENLSSTVKSFNWTDPQVKKQFAMEIEEADQVYSCSLIDEEIKIVGPAPKFAIP